MNNAVNIEKFIKDYLALHLGISVDDISNDDSLKDDLHMGSGDISDVVHFINKKYPIDLTAITDIETVQDLIDTVSENQEF